MWLIQNWVDYLAAVVGRTAGWRYMSGTAADWPVYGTVGSSPAGSAPVGLSVGPCESAVD